MGPCELVMYEWGKQNTTCYDTGYPFKWSHSKSNQVCSLHFSTPVLPDLDSKRYGYSLTIDKQSFCFW